MDNGIYNGGAVGLYSGHDRSGIIGIDTGIIRPRYSSLKTVSIGHNKGVVLDGINDHIVKSGAAQGAITSTATYEFLFRNAGASGCLVGTSSATIITIDNTIPNNAPFIRYQPGTSSFQVIQTLPAKSLNDSNRLVHLILVHYSVGQVDTEYEIMDTYLDGCFVGRSKAATAGVHGGGVLTAYIGSSTGLALYFTGTIYFVRTYGNYTMNPAEVALQYNGGRYNLPLNVPFNTTNSFVDCGLLQDISGNAGRIYTLANGATIEGIPY